ncbi:hypothetical protein [Endozoicomonas atrinae]|uniref:hypothetical protein n=1 Tax=Endozoicomonas atrinae TaxID=1333660 RepID=UPI00082498B7|nr:hypothetical protein [Endozoicomonas atrinae]
MELYKQAFGANYPLGMRIPAYFQDQSYRNDTGDDNRTFICLRTGESLAKNLRPSRKSAGQ